MARKSPGFTFYPDSWLGGTAIMGWAQKGLYMEMLATSWLHGLLDVCQFRDALRIVPDSEDDKMMLRVLASKYVEKDGGFINERLEEERDKQAKRRASGAKGGKKKAANAKAASSKPPSKPCSERPSEKLGTDSDSDSDSEPDTDSLSPSKGSEGGGEARIPEVLSTDQFRKTWDTYRGWCLATSGKQFNEIQGQYALAELAKRGHDKAIADLELTMLKASRVGTIWDSEREFNGNAGSGPKTFHQQATEDSFSAAQRFASGSGQPGVEEDLKLIEGAVRHD